MKTQIKFYNSLFLFYQKMTQKTLTPADLKELLAETHEKIIEIEGKVKSKNANSAIDDEKSFYLGYLELLEETEIALERFNIDHPKYYQEKLDFLIEETRQIIASRSPDAGLKKVESTRSIRAKNMWLLAKYTLRDVAMTLGVAIIFNLILKFTELDQFFAPVIDKLLPIEAGMSALIVFITSFNMSYTNTKRGKTDMALIELTNQLNIYARIIRLTINEKEPDSRKRSVLYHDIDYYFGNMAFNIIEGVRKSNPYHLKFDTVVLRSFDKIKELIDPYAFQLDDISRNRVFSVRDKLISDLNNFHTISTIRVPAIFSALNSWLIRITYFILGTIAPFAILPRLFAINFMQRAFYLTAHETDEAIFDTSLATLPVRERVMKRICRISKVLQ